MSDKKKLTFYFSRYFSLSVLFSLLEKFFVGVTALLVGLGRRGVVMMVRSHLGTLYFGWANARTEWFWDISYGLCHCFGVIVLACLWHWWVGSVLFTLFLGGVGWLGLTWMADKYELWTLELPGSAYPRFYRLCAHVAQFVYYTQILLWPYLDRVVDWYLRCIHDGLKFHFRVNFMVEKAWFNIFFSISGIVGIFSFVPSFIGEGLPPL